MLLPLLLARSGVVWRASQLELLGRLVGGHLRARVGVLKAACIPAGVGHLLLCHNVLDLPSQLLVDRQQLLQEGLHGGVLVQLADDAGACG